MATLEENLEALIAAIGTDHKAQQQAIGVIANLQTAANNLVSAINEVKATADAAVAGTAPNATTTVKGIAEISTDSEALSMSAQDVVLTPGNIGAIRNVANGLAGLDGTGKVAAAQLPSYVDDVREYANEAAFPATGESGVIYVALDNNTQHRWGGSTYVSIAASPGTTDEVVEGVVNLYYTEARAHADANERIAALVGDTNADLLGAYTAAKA